MKTKVLTIKTDQTNAIAEFSLIHCTYIKDLCVLLVLRQKTDPGLKQTPLGLHRPASLIDIYTSVLKKKLALPNSCHSHFAADTTRAYPVPPHIPWTTSSKCPLRMMGSGSSDRLSTGIVDHRRSLTPKEVSEGYASTLWLHRAGSEHGFLGLLTAERESPAHPSVVSNFLQWLEKETHL